MMADSQVTSSMCTQSREDIAQLLKPNLVFEAGYSPKE